MKSLLKVNRTQKPSSATTNLIWSSDSATTETSQLLEPLPCNPPAEPADSQGVIALQSSRSLIYSMNKPDVCNFLLRAPVSDRRAFLVADPAFLPDAHCELRVNWNLIPSFPRLSPFSGMVLDV